MGLVRSLGVGDGLSIGGTFWFKLVWLSPPGKDRKAKIEFSENGKKEYYTLQMQKEKVSLGTNQEIKIALCESPRYNKARINCEAPRNYIINRIYGEQTQRRYGTKLFEGNKKK